MALIDPNRVSDVFRDSLFTEEEVDVADGKPEMVEAKGIVHRIGFNPVRLHSHKDEVKEWIGNLPENFNASRGGGLSFLNLCEDKDGSLWTGSQQVMDQLVTLANGLGFCKILGGDFADALPGGMPYVVFDTKTELDDGLMMR